MSSLNRESPGISPFLELPMEIHFMIYDLLVVSDCPIHLGGLPKCTILGLQNHPWKGPYECIHLHILRVNRQIYGGASIRLYASNTVVIGYGWGNKGLGVFSTNEYYDMTDHEKRMPGRIYAHTLRHFTNIRVEFFLPKFFFQTRSSNMFEDFARIITKTETSRSLSQVGKIGNFVIRNSNFGLSWTTKVETCTFTTCIFSITHVGIALMIDVENGNWIRCCWLTMLGLSNFSELTGVQFQQLENEWTKIIRLFRNIHDNKRATIDSYDITTTQ